MKQSKETITIEVTGLMRPGATSELALHAQIS